MDKKSPLLGKTLVIGVILLLFCMGIIPSVAIDNPIKTISSGNTLYVGGSGHGNYTKIQDAIDNSSDGDTVFVYDDSSPYYESINVNKSISLIGEDKDTTNIDIRKEVATAVILRAKRIIITGFTIQNAGNTGIMVNKNNCSIIHNNIIYNGENGIRLNSGNNLITFNVIRNQDTGIYSEIWAESMGSNTIKRNTFSDLKVGIEFYVIGDNYIEQNNFFNNNINIYVHNERFYWEPPLKNYFYNNYWDRTRLIPKLIISLEIIGFIQGVPLAIWKPLIYVDRRPALKSFSMEE
jgi:parallel beta-helix repeat protein